MQAVVYSHAPSQSVCHSAGKVQVVPSFTGLRACNAAKDGFVSLAAQVPTDRSTSAQNFRLQTSMGSTGKNGTRKMITELVKDLNNSSGVVPGGDILEIMCAPPFVYLDQVSKSLNSRFIVAAQNCWVGKGGAFTGEISAEQLKDIGLKWVIIGHSERRLIIGEDPKFVAKKTAYAQEQGLSVVFCCGEEKEFREKGTHLDVIKSQLDACLGTVTNWTDLVIAYEPVWAIGTGLTASPQDAQEAHAFIRKWLASNVSSQAAQAMRIIYGGSVNEKNSDDLAAQPDVDGFLVGGASLKGSSFARICESANVSAGITAH